MALLTGPKTTTTAVSTPDYLRPYYDRALSRAESAFTEPYKPYTGALTAGIAPLETQGMNAAAGLQLPGQFQSAGNLYNAAGTGVMGLTGFQPSNTAGGVFGGAEAQQYMSPYQQNVTDIAKREAEREFQKQQSQLRARSGAAGAFGGSRATLLETENQRNQNQVLNDIQTKGLQSAFTNAQEQFERDRRARLDAFRLNEDSRMGAADIGLRGYATAANIAQGLGSLGTQIGDESRRNIDTQLGAGLQQREQQQMDLNNQYQQFLEERGYPREQAANFAKVLSGLGSGQTVTQATTPAAGNLEQILGLLTSGTGILGTIGGDKGVSGGLQQIGSLLSPAIGGITSGIGGLFRGLSGTDAGPGVVGSVSGIDDSQFDLGQSSGFNPGAFFNNIGSSVANSFTGLFDNLFRSSE